MLTRIRKSFEFKFIFGGLTIETDCGDVLMCTPIHGHYSNGQLTNWWEQQKKDMPLKADQKEYYLKTVWAKILHTADGNKPTLELYNVYPKGGFAESNSNDMFVAHIPELNFWIIGSNEYTWLVTDKPYKNFTVKISDAYCGSATDSVAQQMFFDI